MTSTRNLASLVATLAVLAGCRADQTLNPPAQPPVPSGGALFQRYVSMGNSIAAGFQSAGINDSTQLLAFPVLFAQQAGAAFVVPLLNRPGCPPPFANNVSQARVSNATGQCYLRKELRGDISNVAVPGAGVLDIFSNFATPPSTYELLTGFFLGGRTEIKAMQDRSPTFVSVEVGPNDVLGALISSTNPGDSAEVTSLATFQASYQALVDSVAQTLARAGTADTGAVLFTVPDVTVIPFASNGAIYYCLTHVGCPSPPFPPSNPQLVALQNAGLLNVMATCAPPGGAATLVPWTIGVARLLKVQKFFPDSSYVIDCGLDNETILAGEIANMQAAVAGFNAFITQKATEKGWALVDANAVLQAAKTGGFIPDFPDLGQVATGGSIGFGPFISLDGFHPSSFAHKQIANAMIAAVNAKYGTLVPAVP